MSCSLFGDKYVYIHLSLLPADTLSRLNMIKSTAPRNIILGTSSSYRKAIVSAMGFKFDIVTADIDERALGDRSSSAVARDLVLLLAKKKAAAILAKLTTEQRERGMSRILLTADQVVTHKGRILEKPTTADEVDGAVRRFIPVRACFRYLHRFSGVWSRITESCIPMHPLIRVRPALSLRNMVSTRKSRALQLEAAY